MGTRDYSLRDALAISLGGVSRKEAELKSICQICKKGIGPFRDELSLREYKISGLCQECQDGVFGRGD